MIKRLVNALIDRIIQNLLRIRFDVHRINENMFELTIYYDGMAIFTQTINLSIPNK